MAYLSRRTMFKVGKLYFLSYLPLIMYDEDPNEMENNYILNKFHSLETLSTYEIVLVLSCKRWKRKKENKVYSVKILHFDKTCWVIAAKEDLRLLKV
jgi:hypothetical protein